MTKIDITKSYQTRTGKKVRLISDRGSEDFPIVGFVGNYQTPVGWTVDGYHCVSKTKSNNDLIPIPQTIQTLPYRRFVRKCDEGYYVTVLVQGPSEPNQIKRIESTRGFTRWLDTDWITTSFELHI